MARPPLEPFHPRDPDYVGRVRASFELQQAMCLIAQARADVAAGRVVKESAEAHLARLDALA